MNSIAKYQGIIPALYAMIKECLRKMGGPDCGSVRAPLPGLIEPDHAIADECAAMIQRAVAKYVG